MAAGEEAVCIRNANGMKMWPHNPGGRWREGPYKIRITVFNVYVIVCFK